MSAPAIGVTHAQHCASAPIPNQCVFFPVDACDVEVAAKLLGTPYLRFSAVAASLVPAGVGCASRKDECHCEEASRDHWQILPGQPPTHIMAWRCLDAEDDGELGTVRPTAVPAAMVVAAARALAPSQWATYDAALAADDRPEYPLQSLVEPSMDQAQRALDGALASLGPDAARQVAAAMHAATSAAAAEALGGAS